jgi:hypothetical protein
MPRKVRTRKASTADLTEITALREEVKSLREGLAGLIAAVRVKGAYCGSLAALDHAESLLAPTDTSTPDVDHIGEALARLFQSRQSHPCSGVLLEPCECRIGPGGPNPFCPQHGQPLVFK